MQGPKYSKAAQKGELGVQRVSSIVFEKLGWIFKRNPQEYDFGIDGQVEIVDSFGTVTGQTFGVQIKYGKSFLNEETRWGYVYRGELKHINYLLNYPLPVFILLCDPESENVYWELFDAAKTERTKAAWKFSVPKNQILNSSKESILSLLPDASDHTDELEKYWLINKVISDYTDDLHLLIAKEWVDAGDISDVVEYFDRLKVSKKLAFSKKSKVELSFYGYDSDPRELFEIPEVVNFSKKIAQELPLFFYCDPSSKLCGLKSIALCYANARFVNSQKLQVSVDNHALSKFYYRQHELLNEVTHWLEMTEEENKDICMPIYEVLGVA